MGGFDFVREWKRTQKRIRFRTPIIFTIKDHF